MPNGKLLVLDGLDGSGKSTQFELLQTALQKQGVSIQAVSFPDYDSPSAALVKMYLNGELSNTPDGVNAYAAVFMRLTAMQIIICTGSRHITTELVF